MHKNNWRTLTSKNSLPSFKSPPIQLKNKFNPINYDPNHPYFLQNIKGLRFKQLKLPKIKQNITKGIKTEGKDKIAQQDKIYKKTINNDTLLKSNSLVNYQIKINRFMANPQKNQLVKQIKKITQKIETFKNSIQRSIGNSLRKIKKLKRSIHLMPQDKLNNSDLIDNLEDKIFKLELDNMTQRLNQIIKKDIEMQDINIQNPQKAYGGESNKNNFLSSNYLSKYSSQTQLTKPRQSMGNRQFVLDYLFINYDEDDEAEK